jgi:hypothetical protein
LEPWGIKFQCSLYADDVIIFIRLSVQEARAVKEILRLFGEASGLKTNLAKCSITPVYGEKRCYKTSSPFWAARSSNFQSSTSASL